MGKKQASRNIVPSDIQLELRKSCKATLNQFGNYNLNKCSWGKFLMLQSNMQAWSNTISVILELAYNLLIQFTFNIAKNKCSGEKLQYSNIFGNQMKGYTTQQARLSMN